MMPWKNDIHLPYVMNAPMIREDRSSFYRVLLSAVSLFTIPLCPRLHASQHLWWKNEGQKEATCLYGEITVLASHPPIYYCGANWHPGEPAGGYCGIQDNSVNQRRTIFCIWDTSRILHPKVSEADDKTSFHRFGGEGEGAHSDMIWKWKTGETFQFFVQKQPGAKPNTTDTRYYVFDHTNRQWKHSATINSPNGGAKSVTNLGGAVVSFLENFLHQDWDEPRIALYRLWLGDDINSMTFLTRARGDNDIHGIWGHLYGSYFLAEGSTEKLNQVFARIEKDFGKPIIAKKGEQLEPIAVVPMPLEVVEALHHLPRAMATHKDSNK